MLRIDRAPGRLTLVSRLARPRVLAVLAGALVLAAVAVRSFPVAAAVLLAAAGLLAVLGGRVVRARFERGRIRVSPAVPFRPGADRLVGEFSAARVETVAEARRRKSERLARQYLARSGGALPEWLHPPDAPGANDHLQRIVLLTRDGGPLAVTAWLAQDEDLEPVRRELEELLG
jgi:hypothetical protein